MNAQVTGTVIDGGLQLDCPVDLPDRSRVNITIEPISKADQTAAWEAFKRRLKERPIHSGGRHFTREELHERR